jgi:hypothetical protein
VEVARHLTSFPAYSVERATLCTWFDRRTHVCKRGNVRRLLATNVRTRVAERAGDGRLCGVEELMTLAAVLPGAGIITWTNSAATRPP